MITEDDVREIAMSLPGTTERSSYGGAPSWRTKERMFAWFRADLDALVLWVEDLDVKQRLLAEAPDSVFTTSHYDGHPVLLLRLGAVDRAEAAELITNSWRVRGGAR